MRVAVDIQWRSGTTFVATSPRVFLTLGTAGLDSTSSWLRSVQQAPAGADNGRAIIRWFGESANTPPEQFVSYMDGLQLGVGATSEQALDAAGVWETTSTGAAYRVQSETLAPHGTVTLAIPAGAASRTGVPLFVYCHGAGGGHNHFSTNSAWKSMREWLISNGWAIVEGTGGGETSWGNQAARDAYVAYIAHARARLNIGPIVAMGRSMGGIVAQWLATRSSVAADISALVLNSAVSTMFVGTLSGGSADKSTAAYFQSSICAAYGVDPAAPDWHAQLQVAAADHAPENWPADVWAGKRILHQYGTADVTVPWYPRGGQYMRDLWAGYPAVDLVDVNVGGDHGVPGQFERVEAVANLLTTLAPSVLPSGVSAGYFDGDTPAVPATAEAAITVESDTAWIQDPLSPRTAVPVYLDNPVPEGGIWLTSAALASATWAQEVDAVTVQGSAYPVASISQRAVAGEVPMTLSYEVLAEGGKLRNLLSSSGQLVVRGLPDGVLEPVAHVVVGDAREDRVGSGSHQIATWELVARQVRPTSLRIVVPYWTYAQVRQLVQDALGAGATYTDVKAAMPSGTRYLDVLRDPKILTGNA
jgi:pimeloyl-ACP methyl ester carboxylesterase